MDCFYGEQPWHRKKLDVEGLIFVADIPRDTRDDLASRRPGSLKEMKARMPSYPREDS
jgi:hypothetical protein